MRRRLALFTLAVAIVFALPAAAAAGAEIAPLSTFGSFGEGAGQFQGGGLASGPNGDFYVADPEDNRVDQFGPDGTFIRAVGGEVAPGGAGVCTTATGCQIGAVGGAAGEFDGVEGIATGPDGDVYAVSYENNRVDVFTAELQFVRAFGEGVLDGEPEPEVCTSSCLPGLLGSGAGEMDEPYGIAVDPVSSDVFVTDLDNHRIDVFTSDGSFIRAIGEEVKQGGGGHVCTEITGCQAGVGNGAAGSVNHGAGIAIPSGGGDLYVVDYEFNERIDQLTQAGEFVRAFGKKVNVADESDICTTASGCKAGLASSEAGALSGPSWDAFDASGNLYVGDYGNARIAVYAANGVFEKAFGAGVLEGPNVEKFQVCTTETGCKEGSGGSGPEAVMHPEGIAFAAGCALPGVYVLGHHVPSPPPAVTRIGRFGDPAAANPCPPPPEEKHETKSPPSNAIELGKLKLNKKRGTALLGVSVPGPGALALSGKGVRGERLHVPGVTTVNLPIALGGKAKKMLAETGKGTIKVTVAFTPDGGTPASVSKIVTLKRQLKKHR